ncbi:MAG: hypothetical protein AB8B63_09765 [Granulosicoccus sp.]
MISRVDDNAHGRRLHRSQSECSNAEVSHPAGWPNAWVSPCVVVIRSYWKVAAEAMTQGSFPDHLACWTFVVLVMASCVDA